MRGSALPFPWTRSTGSCRGLAINRHDYVAELDAVVVIAACRPQAGLGSGTIRQDAEDENAFETNLPCELIGSQLHAESRPGPVAMAEDPRRDPSCLLHGNG